MLRCTWASLAPLGDKRFSAEAWAKNPAAAMVAQAYLLSTTELSWISGWASLVLMVILWIPKKPKTGAGAAPIVALRALASVVSAWFDMWSRDPPETNRSTSFPGSSGSFTMALRR